MVQWDKDSCADAGFLKIDLLGLGMLSAVERCVELIARTRGERIDLSRIPFDDPETFGAIRAADTVGVFQIESRAQMQSLRRTRPENLEELAIQVAIVRPGPIQGGAVNPYIERRQRLREDPAYEIPYEHPVARAGAARDARHDHLPGPGDRGRPGLRRLQPRRGRRAAPGDEPQALARDARAPPRALHRGRRAPTSARDERDRRSASGRWSRASPASASPRRTAPPSACSPTSRRGCACTTARSSCARCSTSSRWASTPPTASSTRRSAAASRCSGSTSTPRRCECTVQDGGVRIGLGYVKGVRGRGGRRRSSPSASGAARFAASPSSPRASGVRARDARAARLVGRLRRARRPSAAARRGREPRRRLSARRRTALWALGSRHPRRERPRGAGTQLALPAGAAGGAPRLRPLGRWQPLLADYATSGVTLGDHALAILRARLTRADARHERPARAPAPRREVAVAGLVIARQRPGTASGTCSCCSRTSTARST